MALNSTGRSSGSMGGELASEGAPVEPDLTNPKVLSWDNTEESLLGKGTFGEVYRCSLVGSDAAVKIVKEVPRRYGETGSQAQKAKLQLEREVRRLSRFRYPHITQYLGAAYDSRRGCTLLVTELMAGGSLQASLTTARNANAPLHPKTFFQVATHIALGLQYLHLLNISHGDIKPANILLTDPLSVETGRGVEGRAVLARNATVKLADFGMSLSLAAEPSGPITATVEGPVERGIQGTLAYLAPEGFRGGKPSSSAAAKAQDIYAMGIVLYGLLSGCEPWEGYNSHMLLGAMNSRDEVTRPKWPNRAGLLRAASSSASAASAATHRFDTLGDSVINNLTQTIESTASEDAAAEGRSDFHRCSLSFELANAVTITERCWAQDPDDRPTADELVAFFRTEDRNFNQSDYEYGAGGGAGVFVRVETGGRLPPSQLQLPVGPGGPGTAMASSVGGEDTYYREVFGATAASLPGADQAATAAMSHMSIHPTPAGGGLQAGGAPPVAGGAAAPGGVPPGWLPQAGRPYGPGGYIQPGHPGAPAAGAAAGGYPQASFHHPAGAYGGHYMAGPPGGVPQPPPAPPHPGAHPGVSGAQQGMYNSYGQGPTPHGVPHPYVAGGTSLPNVLAASESGSVFPSHIGGPGGRSLVPCMRVPASWQATPSSASVDDVVGATSRCRRLARSIYLTDPVHAHDAIAGLADVTEDEEQAVWLVSSAPAVVKRLCWALNWDLRAEARSPALAHDVCAVLSNMAGVCASQPPSSRLASVLTTPEHATAIVQACLNAMSTYSGGGAGGGGGSAGASGGGRPDGGNERVCAAAADALSAAFQRRDAGAEAHPGEPRAVEITAVLRDVLALAIHRHDPDLTRAALGATCAFVRLCEPAAREVAVGPADPVALALAFSAVTEVGAGSGAGGGGVPGGGSASGGTGGSGGIAGTPAGARVDLEGFALLASVAFFPALRPAVLFAGGTVMLRALLGRHRGSPTWRSAIVTALSTLLGGWGHLKLREAVRQRALSRFASDGGCEVAVQAVRLCVDATEGGGGGGSSGEGLYGLAAGSGGSSLSASGSGGFSGGGGGAVAAAAGRPVLVRRLELLSLQVLRMLYRRDPGLLQSRVLEAGAGEAVLLLLRARGGGLAPEAALEGVLVVRELTAAGWRGEGVAGVLRELKTAYGAAGGVADAAAEALKVVGAVGRRGTDGQANR